MSWATPEAREQIATMLRAGASGGDIAARFKVTRNAVIGVVHRDKWLKGIGFIRSPGWRQKEETPRPAASTRRPRKPPKFYPQFVPEPHNVTLMELDNTTCRWPVNDPPQGTNGHLFCGHEPEHKSSYCSFHARMSEGAGTESERSADRTLEHAG